MLELTGCITFKDANSESLDTLCDLPMNTSIKADVVIVEMTTAETLRLECTVVPDYPKGLSMAQDRFRNMLTWSICIVLYNSALQFSTSTQTVYKYSTISTV